MNTQEGPAASIANSSKKDAPWDLCKCCGRKMDNEKALTQSEDDRYYLVCMNPDCKAFLVERPY